MGRKLYYCGCVEEPSTPKFLQILWAQDAGHTDVYADPMFVALKLGDFRPKPDSPALKMGIKQIDLKGVRLARDFPKRLLD